MKAKIKTRIKAKTRLIPFDMADHLESPGAIAEYMQAGRFSNGELIRNLICREQERSADVEAVRQALIEGERSGEPQPFNFAAFTRRKRASHGG